MISAFKQFKYNKEFLRFWGHMCYVLIDISAASEIIHIAHIANNKFMAGKQFLRVLYDALLGAGIRIMYGDSSNIPHRQV